MPAVHVMHCYNMHFSSESQRGRTKRHLCTDVISSYATDTGRETGAE